MMASDELPSGRFVLRIEPTVHAMLREAAAGAGLSLNEYCVRKLLGCGTAVSGPGWRAVERAADVVGAKLVGVVVYGSWARGGATERSDIDVLIVVDDDVAVTRELYGRWDAEPVFWAAGDATREYAPGVAGAGRSHRVEPHFVHMPPAGETPSGTWAEVALDGMVVFDRDLAVSRRLVALRSAILSGSLARYEVHGQPYWVEGS